MDEGKDLSPDGLRPKRHLDRLNVTYRYNIILAEINTDSRELFLEIITAVKLNG